MTNFPLQLDLFSNPSGNSFTNDPALLHSAQHANANDAIEALQVKVGVNNQSDQNSLDYKATNLKNRLEGWNDLVQPVTVRQGVPNAPGLNPIIGGIYGYEFDPDVMNECFATFHMGHDYIPGSMIFPHVHWTTNVAASGCVRWGCEYTWARRADGDGMVTFQPTRTLYIDVCITGDNILNHMVSESIDGQGIPGDTIDVDSIILCRFFRDSESGFDTFAHPIFLLSVDLHYQSLSKTTPSRFPPFV